jgi:hypothetical protein
MIHALHVRQIDRYFAGSLHPAAVTDMFRRLWRCGACRLRYERHLLAERALPDGDTRPADRLWRSIVASADTAAASSPAALPTPPASGRWFRPSALVTAGALAGALVLVGIGTRGRIVPAPVARGGDAEDPGAPTVHLFRSVGEHRTEPVAQTVHADDGILIAYSNPRAELSYLMVFAVDIRGDVHWYYPAYEQPGQNPAAPAIRTRALGVELGEEIRHALPVGPLRVFSLFLRHPLRVQEVERMVADAWRARGGSVTALESLPLDDGTQVSRLLEVTP